MRVYAKKNMYVKRVAKYTRVIWPGKKDCCHMYVVEVQSFCGHNVVLPSQWLRPSFPSGPKSDGFPRTYVMGECLQSMSLSSNFFHPVFTHL